MIAISYRREDSLPIAGRLYDRLEAKFGKQNIFMDFDSIRPGLDFRSQIKDTIEQSRVVLAIVGPHWLGDHGKHRRIDEPTDFVRIEIAQALTRGVPVIPVLVNNTPMPKPEKLPAEIRELAFRHAVPLDSGLDFHQHADRLIASIQELIGPDSPIDSKSESRVSGKPRRQLLLLATAVFLVLAGLLVFWSVRSRKPESSETKPVQEQQNLATQRTTSAGQPTPSIPPDDQSDAAVVPTTAVHSTPLAFNSNPNTSENFAPNDEARVRQLIRDYYAALSRHDLESLLSKFSDTVNYQGKGLQAKRFIRVDATNYMRKWSRIFFDVTDIAVSRSPEGDFVARFDAPFAVGEPNAADKTGVSSNVWILRSNAEGKLQIISQQESVLNGHSRQIPRREHH